MSTDSKFAPRSLTASEYVRELFGPEDNAAILVRNRSTGHTSSNHRQGGDHRKPRLSILARGSECQRFRRVRGNESD